MTEGRTLEQLPARWREQSRADYSAWRTSTLAQCADELEAALAAVPAQPSLSVTDADGGKDLYLRGEGWSLLVHADADGAMYSFNGESGVLAAVPAQAGQAKEAEHHLTTIWGRLGLSAQARLMSEGHGLDPIIRILRQAAISPAEPAPAPKNVEDALHAVFTQHGIASRSDYPFALISDLIGWAAEMCRQSRAAVPPANPVTLYETASPEDRRIVDNFMERVAVVQLKAKAIGGGAKPISEDDSRRSWTCGCYEDQGRYHLCLQHSRAMAGEPAPAPAPSIGTHERESAVRDEVGSVPDVPANSAPVPAPQNSVPSSAVRHDVAITDTNRESWTCTPAPAQQPEEGKIFEVAERVAAGQADNADAATLLAALAAARRQLAEAQDRIVDLKASAEASAAQRDGAIADMQRAVTQSAREIRRLEKHLADARRQIVRFQDGTLLGKHGRQQADKIAALREALATKAAAWREQAQNQRENAAFADANWTPSHAEFADIKERCADELAALAAGGPEPGVANCTFCGVPIPPSRSEIGLCALHEKNAANLEPEP